MNNDISIDRNAIQFNFNSNNNYEQIKVKILSKNKMSFIQNVFESFRKDKKWMSVKVGDDSYLVEKSEIISVFKLEKNRFKNINTVSSDELKKIYDEKIKSENVISNNAFVWNKKLEYDFINNKDENISNVLINRLKDASSVSLESNYCLDLLDVYMGDFCKVINKTHKFETADEVLGYLEELLSQFKEVDPVGYIIFCSFIKNVLDGNKLEGHQLEMNEGGYWLTNLRTAISAIEKK